MAKETKDSSQRLNKAEKSWILYDVANLMSMIVTATIPIYFAVWQKAPA